MPADSIPAKFVLKKAEVKSVKLATQRKAVEYALQLVGIMKRRAYNILCIDITSVRYAPRRRDNPIRDHRCTR